MWPFKWKLLNSTFMLFCLFIIIPAKEIRDFLLIYFFLFSTTILEMKGFWSCIGNRNGKSCVRKYQLVWPFNFLWKHVVLFHPFVSGPRAVSLSASRIMNSPNRFQDQVTGASNLLAVFFTPLSFNPSVFFLLASLLMFTYGGSCFITLWPKWSAY